MMSDDFIEGVIALDSNNNRFHEPENGGDDE